MQIVTGEDLSLAVEYALAYLHKIDPAIAPASSMTYAESITPPIASTSSKEHPLYPNLVVFCFFFKLIKNKRADIILGIVLDFYLN